MTASRSAAPHRAISVMITAMNEEGNLEPTVDNVVRAVSSRFEDYEVLIMEDGSTDRTGAIAERMAAANPRIVVHSSGVNRGLGYTYRKGIELASKPLMMWVAGNNIVSLKGMIDVCDQADAADLVLGYMLSDVRRLNRRLISRSFAMLLNVLFGLRLKYYTGLWICRTNVVKSLRLIGHGSMITPEIPVRIILNGYSHVDVGYHPQPRTAGKTKTFRLSNVFFVVTSILRLFWDIRVAGRRTPPVSEQFSRLNK